MTPTDYLILAAAAVLLVALVFLCFAYYVPEGYEDDDGFHYGIAPDDPTPRCGITGQPLNLIDRYNQGIE